jgi:uncharacterized protein (DUF2336 family)
MAPGLIVRQFLLWARNAPAHQRAKAVAGLAHAYLFDGKLSADDRREARTALTAMLDDPSPLVRLAMAEALADAAESPHHLVIALANDQSEVAALVLARSPVLTDADLVDCAALGDEAVQAAIAGRLHVSVATSAALAEIATPGALAALAENRGADIAEASLWRMVERHGTDPVLRRALLRHPHLPIDLRHAVALAVSDDASAFVRDRGWLSPGRAERTFGDARDRATVAMATAAPPDDAPRLVAYLRRTGQLTPALMLRALLSRSMPFVEAAFAELTRLPPDRVAGLLHDRRGPGFRAVLDRAGLPDNLRPAFAAAVLALRDQAPAATERARAQLSGRMLERVLAVCARLPEAETGHVMALLRRFEAEVARDAAREATGGLAQDGAFALTRDREPMALLDLNRVALRDAA